MSAGQISKKIHCRVSEFFIEVLSKKTEPKYYELLRGHVSEAPGDIILYVKKHLRGDDLLTFFKRRGNYFKVDEMNNVCLKNFRIQKKKINWSDDDSHNESSKLKAQRKQRRVKKTVKKTADEPMLHHLEEPPYKAKRAWSPAPSVSSSTSSSVDETELMQKVLWYFKSTIQTENSSLLYTDIKYDRLPKYIKDYLKKKYTTDKIHRFLLDHSKFFTIASNDIVTLVPSSGSESDDCEEATSCKEKIVIETTVEQSVETTHKPAVETTHKPANRKKRKMELADNIDASILTDELIIAIKFFVEILESQDRKSIRLNSLMGHLSQASHEIREFFHTNFRGTLFKGFFTHQPNIFKVNGKKVSLANNYGIHLGILDCFLPEDLMPPEFICSDVATAKDNSALESEPLDINLRPFNDRDAVYSHVYTSRSSKPSDNSSSLLSAKITSTCFSETLEKVNVKNVEDMDKNHKNMAQISSIKTKHLESYPKACDLSTTINKNLDHDKKVSQQSPMTYSVELQERTLVGKLNAYSHIISAGIGTKVKPNNFKGFDADENCKKNICNINQSNEAISRILPSVKSNETISHISLSAKSKETISRISSSIKSNETISHISLSAKSKETISCISSSVKSNETIGHISPRAKSKEAISRILPSIKSNETISHISPSAKSNEAISGISPSIKSKNSEACITILHASESPKLKANITILEKTEKAIIQQPDKVNTNIKDRYTSGTVTLSDVKKDALKESSMLNAACGLDGNALKSENTSLLQPSTGFKTVSQNCTCCKHTANGCISKQVLNHFFDNPEVDNNQESQKTSNDFIRNIPVNPLLSNPLTSEKKRAFKERVHRSNFFSSSNACNISFQDRVKLCCLLWTLDLTCLEHLETYTFDHCPEAVEYFKIVLNSFSTSNMPLTALKGKLGQASPEICLYFKKKYHGEKFKDFFHDHGEFHLNSFDFVSISKSNNRKLPHVYKNLQALCETHEFDAAYCHLFTTLVKFCLLLKRRPTAGLDNLTGSFNYLDEEERVIVKAYKGCTLPEKIKNLLSIFPALFVVVDAGWQVSEKAGMYMNLVLKEFVIKQYLNKRIIMNDLLAMAIGSNVMLEIVEFCKVCTGKILTPYFNCTLAYYLTSEIETEKLEPVLILGLKQLLSIDTSIRYSDLSSLLLNQCSENVKELLCLCNSSVLLKVMATRENFACKQGVIFASSSDTVDANILSNAKGIDTIELDIEVIIKESSEISNDIISCDSESLSTDKECSDNDSQVLEKVLETACMNDTSYIVESPVIHGHSQPSTADSCRLLCVIYDRNCDDNSYDDVLNDHCTAFARFVCRYDVIFIETAVKDNEYDAIGQTTSLLLSSNSGEPPQSELPDLVSSSSDDEIHDFDTNYIHDTNLTRITSQYLCPKVEETSLDSSIIEHESSQNQSLEQLDSVSQPELLYSRKDICDNEIKISKTLSSDEETELIAPVSEKCMTENNISLKLKEPLPISEKSRTLSSSSPNPVKLDDENYAPTSCLVLLNGISELNEGSMDCFNQADSFESSFDGNDWMRESDGSEPKCPDAWSKSAKDLETSKSNDFNGFSLPVNNRSVELDELFYGACSEERQSNTTKNIAPHLDENIVISSIIAAPCNEEKQCDADIISDNDACDKSRCDSSSIDMNEKCSLPTESIKPTVTVPNLKQLSLFGRIILSTSDMCIAEDRQTKKLVYCHKNMYNPYNGEGLNVSFADLKVNDLMYCQVFAPSQDNSIWVACLFRHLFPDELFHLPGTLSRDNENSLQFKRAISPQSSDNQENNPCQGTTHKFRNAESQTVSTGPIFHSKCLSDVWCVGASKECCA